jgi:hypothetical protein
VGEDPRTYSTILTPKPPVSEERGDRILDASLPGKLPDRRGGTIVIGCDTEWSAKTERNNEMSKIQALGYWRKHILGLHDTVSTRDRNIFSPHIFWKDEIEIRKKLVP